MDALSIALKWLLGFLLFWKVPRAKPSNQPNPRTPLLSVIIPARNESHNLPELLASLSAQSLKPHEVIVVDDDSSDDTTKVASLWGATVISAGPIQNGWTGKTSACWKGAQASTGALLLFLDADTRLAPNPLASMSAEFFRQTRGLVSWYPFHTMHTAYERLSAFFNFVSMMSLGIATIAGSKIRPLGAYGACILCDRQDYFMVGGHKAVGGAIAEDIALGRLFSRRGLPMKCLAGKGIVSFRMYPDGIRALIQGWSKNFATGARSSRLSLSVIVVLWITGALQTTMGVPLLAFRGGGIDDLARATLLYAAYALQIYWMLCHVGTYGLATSLLFPVPLLFFVGVFIYSVIATFFIGRVRWRGRSIALRNLPGHV